MMPQSVTVNHWARPLGEPGDLADVIVATLSLAHAFGFTKVSKPDFYKIFSQLTEEFPDLFPPMVFTQTGDYLYSKTLGDALEQSLRTGLVPMNPRFFYFGLQTPDQAGRNLELIKENNDDRFIERLKPLAERFATLVNESAHPSA